jgi:hypothetical protein
MTDPKFEKSADFVRSANLDIEADINKQWLPSGKVGTYNPDEFSIHRGSHPKYTKDVNRDLEALYTQADDERWSTQKRQSAIDDFLMATKAELLDGGRALNRAIDHSSAGGYREVLAKANLGGVTCAGGYIQTPTGFRAGELEVWVKGCQDIRPEKVTRLVDELTQLYYVHDMLPTMHFEGHVGTRALVLVQSFGEVRRVLMSADFWMKCLTTQALYVAPQGGVSRDNVVLFSQERAVLAV